MFKLLRFYSIASFISIFITAALLTLFYREVSIHWITQLAEKNNIALGQTALNSFRPALMKQLERAAKIDPRGMMPQKFPDDLVAAIENVMHDTSAIRFKVYDHNGVIAYSSKASQIGTNQSRHDGFMAAIGGTIASSLVYRDRFNLFDKITEEDNLLQSYIPLRRGPDEPVLGVFEIYTDVSQMVQENERKLFIILLGAEFIMATLFATLVLVVRRANQHLDRQQQAIRKRTETLESLSNRLLNSDEQEKKKIAFDLHEGLAQTLSAIKTNVESSRMLIGPNNVNAKALESIVPVIQSAIQEVRSIATELRPSSLDDLGLIPTINWFRREFERSHPGIQIGLTLTVAEADIPAALKIVIYRIIESAFNDIALHVQADWIQLALQIENGEITLIISATSEAPSERTEQRPDLQFRFAEAQERTNLSSGLFSATQDLIGKITLTSSWPSQETMGYQGA